jgi:SAM-dependent methyltransferase
MLPFTVAPAGEDVYEWLTAIALGTQRGMSRKWCLWFREHVVLCRRYAKAELAGRRIWLYEPGWSLAPVMLARLVTEGGPLVTEPCRRLARRYVATAVSEVGRVAGQMCRSAGRDGGPSAGLLESLWRASSARQVLRACEADYRVGGPAELDRVPSESVDICMSMGRLEHLPEGMLREVLSHMRRILAPRGVGSHIVDHRDHFWHFDKSGHCFRHLTFSEQEWARIARGRKLYRNRLVESDYVRLFEEAEMEVVGCVHELHRNDTEGVDPRTLWGRYRDLSSHDLEAAVSHFIVRRK